MIGCTWKLERPLLYYRVISLSLCMSAAIAVTYTTDGQRTWFSMTSVYFFWTNVKTRYIIAARRQQPTLYSTYAYIIQVLVGRNKLCLTQVDIYEFQQVNRNPKKERKKLRETKPNMWSSIGADSVLDRLYIRMHSRTEKSYTDGQNDRNKFLLEPRRKENFLSWVLDAKGYIV